MKRILTFAFVLLMCAASMAQITTTPRQVQDGDFKTSPYLIFWDGANAQYYTPSYSHEKLMVDTLYGANDTVKFPLDRKYLFGILGLTDIDDAFTDSLLIFSKSLTTGKLTSKMIGFRDLSTNDILDINQPVVMGQGLEKQYLCLRPYPSEIWVTWATKSGKATRKCIMYLLGKGN